MMKFLRVLLALCLLLGALTACQNANNGGDGSSAETEPVILEGVISATAEGYELDNAVVAFFFYDNFNTFVNQNYYYLSLYGLDLNKSLKEQTMSSGDDTWFDYFMDGTKDLLNQMIALAVEAKAKGMALTDEDQKLIDDYIADMTEYATENKFEDLASFLADYYVSGMTEAAVRQALALQLLASNYYDALQKEFTFTDDDFTKYREEHPEVFLKTDYLCYGFPVTYDKDATEEDKAAAVAKTKADAEAFLAKATDAETFLSLIKATEGFKESDLAYYDITGDKYLKDDAFTEWAFAADRAVGDKTVIEEKDPSNKDAVGGYTVYLLKKTAYFDDYATKNVRHILFTAKTYETSEAAKKKAEEVLALYEQGEKTAEAFGALAKEYTEDGNGDVGGLYENVPQGMMVETFNDWMFDPVRQVGDVGIVETTYGYHIMYHVGDGEIAWKLTAEEKLLEEANAAKLEELIKVHPVTYDDAKLNEIP